MKKSTLLFFIFLVFSCNIVSGELLVSVEHLEKLGENNLYVARIFIENNTGVITFSLLVNIIQPYTIINVSSDNFIIVYNIRNTKELLILGVTASDNSELRRLEICRILLKSETPIDESKVVILKALIKRSDGTLIKYNYSSVEYVIEEGSEKRDVKNSNKTVINYDTVPNITPVKEQKLTPTPVIKYLINDTSNDNSKTSTGINMINQSINDSKKLKNCVQITTPIKTHGNITHINNINSKNNSNILPSLPGFTLTLSLATFLYCCWFLKKVKKR